jgi:hypothetical protein
MEKAEAVDFRTCMARGPLREKKVSPVEILPKVLKERAL